MTSKSLLLQRSCNLTVSGAGRARGGDNRQEARLRIRGGSVRIHGARAKDTACGRAQQIKPNMTAANCTGAEINPQGGDDPGLAQPGGDPGVEGI